MARKRQYGSGQLVEQEKGVGDPLAGERDCSRRHSAAGAALRASWPDVAPRGVRRFWRRSMAAAAGKKALKSRVTFDMLASGMEANGGADVQAFDAEEPPAHRSQASRSTLRRDGGGGRDDAGDSGVCRASHERRLRAKDHRPYPRRAERDSPHGGQVGPSRRESGARRVDADADGRSSRSGR